MGEMTVEQAKTLVLAAVRRADREEARDVLVSAYEECQRDHPPEPEYVAWCAAGRPDDREVQRLRSEPQVLGTRIPDYWHEAKAKWPWLPPTTEALDDAWRNRTRAENALWLIAQAEQEVQRLEADVRRLTQVGTQAEQEVDQLKTQAMIAPVDPSVWWKLNDETGRLRVERDELKRKGEDLCHAYGNHLVEHGVGGRCEARLREVVKLAHYVRDGLARGVLGEHATPPCPCSLHTLLEEIAAQPEEGK